LLDEDVGEQQAILCLVDGFKYQYKVRVVIKPITVMLMTIMVILGPAIGWAFFSDALMLFFR
jgi:hypothetical protein